jgi:pyrroline-5-carboxylate reductase
MPKKIAFIGGGNMANALIAGLLGRVCGGEHMHVVDLNPDTLRQLALQYGVSTAGSIDAQVSRAEIVLLAVKPQQMQQVARTLAPLLRPEQLVISIAAGIMGADLARWLGHAAIVRCMPNTPALITQGITGMVALPGVSRAQRYEAERVMGAVGETMWFEQEDKLDAVTALSGSGPAYVFYFLEAMQQAGQELGLSAEDALQLARHTFLGATQLAMQSSEPVSVLRERVTSKGGTTYAALSSMQQNGVGPALVSAIKAASARAAEMGREFGIDDLASDPASGA